MKIITHCTEKFSRLSARFDFLPALLTRIVIGVVFIESGWGKLTHLSKVVEFFVSLGIPAAHLQAPFVAGLELVAGILILLGFATRFASVPLIAIMLVAIRTAKWEDVSGLSSIFGLSEALYIVLLLWLIVRGAGPASIDAIIQNRCGCGESSGNPEK